MRISLDVAVLQMGEDESGPSDVADLARAGGDVPESAPAVLDAYHWRYAISGTHMPPVLLGGPHRRVTAGTSTGATKGLLLRSDVHLG